MIAQNVAHRAILARHSVLFTTAARMLADLGSVHGTPHLFQQRLRKYTRVELLVCDEVGYLSYDSRAADLLFQVVVDAPLTEGDAEDTSADERDGEHGCEGAAP